MTTSARAIVEALTLDQQIGLLFHPMILIDAHHDIDAPSALGPSTRELIEHRGIRHLCLGGTPTPDEVVDIVRRLQALATSTGSKLPIVFSTDPRHSFLQVDGASHKATGVSQWPEPIGLGAIGDASLVRNFARVVRDDYRSMGIRMALHPQVDLTTDARWARQAQSFGTNAETTSRLVEAYLEGLQGASLAADSVAAVVKHFPGGGAQQDGEDPHFPYGREQIYPGGTESFETHLAPFRAAISAGAAVIMPYYGMPIGLTRGGEAIEEVGFSFNRQIITGILRDELGFNGVVLSDFGLVHDVEVFGKPFPARAWGVEHLTSGERVAKMLEAGVDQFGGDSEVSVLRELVSLGVVSPERITESATRIVSVMLNLGFTPGTVPTANDTLSSDFTLNTAEGLRAQSRAVTVLTDRNEALSGSTSTVLPLPGHLRVHTVGVAESALPAGWSRSDLEEADVALIRVNAPFEHRDTYFLEAGMQQGSLEFTAETVEHVRTIASRVPVVLAVTLSRPAVLTPLLPYASAVVGEYGASDSALIDALTAKVEPEGRLPFELPRSMHAVASAFPDVGANTEDPLFPLGWGLDISQPDAPTSYWKDTSK